MAPPLPTSGGEVCPLPVSRQHRLVAAAGGNLRVNRRTRHPNQGHERLTPRLIPPLAGPWPLSVRIAPRRLLLNLNARCGPGYNLAVMKTLFPAVLGLALMVFAPVSPVRAIDTMPCDLGPLAEIPAVWALTPDKLEQLYPPPQGARV